MAGMRQKPPEALQNKRGGRYKPLQLIPPGERAVPRCPSGVGAKAKSYWKQLWTSPIAGAWADVDALSLGRYLKYVDEWLLTMANIEEVGSTVEGRRGGPVLNPEVGYMLRLEVVIRDIERAFGLDPMSRLRLGISLAKKHDPLASLKASAVIREYKERLEERQE